jgi:hypothetical protein
MYLYPGWWSLYSRRYSSDAQKLNLHHLCWWSFMFVNLYVQASTLTFVRLSCTSENWRRTNRFCCPKGQVKKWLSYIYSYLLKVIFYNKTLLLCHFYRLNFVNNDFNVCKNIGFHWSTLSLITMVNQEIFRIYTWSVSF